MQQFNLLFKFSLKLSLLFIAPLLLLLNQTTDAQLPVLYGTSYEGGVDSVGSIYKINSNGSGFTTVYSFSSGLSGSAPFVINLVFYNGKFYGTTGSGGVDTAGVIFSFDPSNNTYTKLLDFNHSNGEVPYNGLTLAGNKFYGTTSAGGAHHMGVIYSFDPISSVYNDIFDFDSTNGSVGYGQLVLASNGTLYGTTPLGGQFNKGTVFSLTPPSTFEKILDFDSIKGNEPAFNKTITDGGNGKIYGTTLLGGNQNMGVVYTINMANNSYQKVFDFDSTHGNEPGTGLVLAANGKLYGTAIAGGANNAGVLFSVDPSNDSLAVVHSFNTLNDGGYSVSAMIKGSDNILYGTAFQGGGNGVGTIFSFDPATNTFTKIHDCTQIDYYPYSGLAEAITSTGIVPVTEQAVITVSPNPVMDMAVLHFSSATESEYRLTVTDVTGKVLMLKESVTSTGNQEQAIDLSSFSAGIYFVTMSATNGQQWQSLKLVKQ